MIILADLLLVFPKIPFGFYLAGFLIGIVGLIVAASMIQPPGE